jgi:hypothetical protein
MNGEERETSTHVMKPKTSRSTGDQEPQSGRTPWLSAAAKGERDLQTRLQGGREMEGFKEWRLACVDLPACPSAFFPFPLPFPFTYPLLSGGLQRISKYRGVVMVHGSIQGKGGRRCGCHAMEKMHHGWSPERGWRRRDPRGDADQERSGQRWGAAVQGRHGGTESEKMSGLFVNFYHTVRLDPRTGLTLV